ncbi:restriction endonuclease subunit S [Pseudomonas extremorientalis]|uniref:Restriction endonuclease n=1 Tax=Pseudomonas extremorientalis TaxID=169669 RepID=A0A1H0QZ88_9PSED|nr:restriction endonuclease subunit S [Pseudomonas extremorientalis]KAB0519174.1 restriction endonuclease subunit S [Pseudomonas extremorientalis]OIN09459.1 restriction endonuclease [Pseudomonas extremorientalis]SDP22622.1 type I restriction enzyme, S subunit [Pseudomonas extremorientalis]
MTALLTDNLPLLAGAPNGIKKLRELILELAVRGKLVPQDPNDEPANKLLKRIAEEKARLVAEGKFKKQKPLTMIYEEAQPFELPAGWKWSSLVQVAFVNPRNAATDSLEVSFVPMTFIGTRFDDQHAQEPRLWGEVKQGFTHFAEGDIGVAKITPCFENSKACVFSNLVNGLGAGTTELHIVRPVTGTLDPRYVLAYLKSPQFLLVGETKMTGTAGQKRLPKDFVEANPFPLPPLAEQHRIVAKVDELMTLCDRLEAQQADAGNAHAQLVQALLDSLTQARDATEFAANWQRLAEHFHTLFTTEPSIGALKQTLLQLAVMGKLLTQDPSDEPAGELIKKIEREKNRQIETGKLKRPKQADPIDGVNKSFQIPTSWEWTRLANITFQITDGAHHTPTYIDAGIPFLSVKDMSGGTLDFTATRFISEEAHELLSKRCHPQRGDLLLTKIGTTGVPVIVDTDQPFSIFVSVGLIKAPWDHLNVNYLQLLIGSPFVKKQSADGTEGVGNKNLVLRKIANFLIAIPPLAEQHRIVAKVEELMVFCNQLKTRLTRARQLNEQLASTLVERALAGNVQQTPIGTHQQAARTLLAAEVTHRLHNQRTFGQRKLQKVIYLAEHAAGLSAIQGEYLRDAAGPHDRQLMNKVEGQMQTHQWYERIERETVGHAYRPLSQAGQHRQAYSSAWSVAERATIEQVIELMRDWDTDRCEMTVTLYAAWNDFILEGRLVSDEAIVNEVMHSWNDTKLRFGKTEWLAVIAEMKKHKILMPTGFGKRTKGGMLSLPGFE